MKPPVLVVAAASGARAVRAVLANEYALTITDDVERARSLAATGAFLAILAVEPLHIAHAITIDPGDPAATVAAVTAAIDRTAATHREQARRDEVGAVSYEDYIELARYALTRRYLLALLSRYGGSVTDAARGANMKRESLHRLMRRHHVTAEDFRER